MKKRDFIYKIIAIFISFSFLCPLGADTSSTTPEPYRDNEFPQFLKDARRFEIITLGALPFVTLDTTLAYSTYRYGKHDFNDDDIELFGALMKLDVTYRLPVHLFYFNDYSYKEIAKVLNLTESAVAMRIKRGREQLRELLEN